MPSPTSATSTPTLAPTVIPSALPTTPRPLTATPTPTLAPTVTRTPTRTVPAISPSSLRYHAQARNLLIGAAVAPNALRNDNQYTRTLAQEFNILVPENALKFGPLRPSRERWSFADADDIVAFAEANTMRVRGHTLVWHNAIPNWLVNGNFSDDEIKTILRDHITTLVSRYRGRVYAWDVVNEAIEDSTGNLRDTFWRKHLGDDYIALVFEWAHQADPQALLFYNDFNNEGLSKKSDAVYKLVQNLKQRGVPIHGVGIQAHLSVTTNLKPADVIANLQRLAALGLEIHITELDVRMPVPASEKNLHTQAQVYRDMMHACLTVPNCKAFLMWGLTDKYSWVPNQYAGYGAALIFDEGYKPKPAFNGLMDALKNQ